MASVSCCRRWSRANTAGTPFGRSVSGAQHTFECVRLHGEDALRQKDLHLFDAGRYFDYAKSGFNGAHQNDSLMPHRDPPITHLRGEPVTFCFGTLFTDECTGVMPQRQAQTKRRKNPVLMRFLHGDHGFHEKMTFGYRFEHACCIQTHIVGNNPCLEVGVTR